MKALIKKFIPPFFLNWYHFFLAFLGAVLYRFPSRKIKAIGVTGTNGKTTTVNLIAQILEGAGFKTASLSSIKFKIGKEEKENLLKMTMPGRFKIQKFLRKAVNSGCKYVILEVSSEGIKQNRHRFINFKTAVFTNLSPEHIESHKGFENYKREKGKFFKSARETHVVNIDDENSDYFLKFPSKKKYLYGIKNNYPNFKMVIGKNAQVLNNGIRFFVDDVEFKSNLLGEFNIYNSLAAISVGLSEGISLEICKEALKKAESIPGRMEIVVSNPFKVVVDYAVTPDALEKLYLTLKEMFSPQKMIAVLGACGGGRDKWKRSVLGEVAAKYCNQVILTNEDPYDEPPEKIMNEIAVGIRGNTSHKSIVDRREAIKEALKLAKPNDVVVITGKGCEPWICVKGGRKIPWDDRRVAREEFDKLSL